MPPRRAQSGIFQCLKRFWPVGRMDKALKATESIALACGAMGSVRMLGMVDHDDDEAQVDSSETFCQPQ